MDAMPPSAVVECPHWCVERHGLVAGEDDWLHTGMVTTIGRQLVVKLCMTADPSTGAIDGPHVLLGTQEVTLDDARTLGEALIEMADSAGGAGTPVPRQARQRR
jgi:hypothetical protein